MNIFDTKDINYIKTTIINWLEENSRYVDVTRNDEHFVEAKVKNYKRLYFYLHYDAFRFKGRNFEMVMFNDYIDIKIGGADLDITRLELKGFLDNVSFDIDY